MFFVNRKSKSAPLGYRIRELHIHMKNETHYEQSSTPYDTTDSVRSEIQEYLDISQQRRCIFPRAALVGDCAGIVALLFRAALTGVDVSRNGMLSWVQSMPKPLQDVMHLRLAEVVFLIWKPFFIASENLNGNASCR